VIERAGPDAESAKQVENRIWALWIASGSDTANLLMTRAKTAIDSNDLDLAIELEPPRIGIRRHPGRPGAVVPDEEVVALGDRFVEACDRRFPVHGLRGGDVGRTRRLGLRPILLWLAHRSSRTSLGRLRHSVPAYPLDPMFVPGAAPLVSLSCSS